jgi:hypothetical protein
LLQKKKKKNYIFCVCVYTLSYPAYKSVRLYNIVPHYIINGTILGGKRDTEHKMCISHLSATSTWNLSHSKKDSASTQIFTYKVPVAYVRFERHLNILDILLYITLISNSMKIRPLGADLFHADGQMDRQTRRN